MGIFTSQKRSLQDLPKPSSFEFGSVKNLDLPELKESISSVSPKLDVSEKEDIKAKKQVFVKMDHYKEALETIDKIREKIKDADLVLNDLRNMKSKEDEHLAKWHKDLEVIKEKLSKMDEVLYDIENE
jgi:valyl-tRNA synthetase